MLSPRRHLRSLIAVLAAAAIGAGCGGDDGSPATPALTTPTIESTADELSEEARDRVDEAVRTEGSARGAEQAIREACIEQAERGLSGEDERRAVDACEQLGK